MLFLAACLVCLVADLLGCQAAVFLAPLLCSTAPGMPVCRLGDRVGVTLAAGSPGGFGAGGNWFEGVCEKVDLR
jgi:hypothetical protein